MVDRRLNAMLRTVPALVATAVVLVGLVLAAPHPAHACSLVPPVEMAEVQALLEGGVYQGDSWLPEDAHVTGFIEYTVLEAWEATLDYEPASARVATRAWGPVEGRHLRGAIVGGEPRGPMVGFDSCGRADPGRLGQRTFQIVLDGTGINPVSGVLTPETEQLLSASLGEPTSFDPPEFDDRHPGYGTQRHGWQDHVTWGRILWALAAILFLPVAAFASWLRMTRRT